jgi:hypothetical protein
LAVIQAASSDSLSESSEQHSSFVRGGVEDGDMHVHRRGLGSRSPSSKILRVHRHQNPRGRDLNPRIDARVDGDVHLPIDDCRPKLHRNWPFVTHGLLEQRRGTGVVVGDSG